MKTCGLLMAVLVTAAQAQRPAELGEFGAMLQRGHELQASGRHLESQRHFAKLARAAKDMDPFSEAVALAWLGSTYFELRRFAEAERALVRCLELRDRLWGSRNERDPNHARILTSLGGVEVSLRRYQAAEQHLNEALRIWRGVPGGQKHGEFATSLNNFAMLNCARKLYSEAAVHLREVVALWQASLPADDRRLAQARSNLAGVLSRLGLHDEADAFSSEALAGFRDKLDQEPLIAAELLTVRCAVLRKAKRGREAKSLEALAREFLRKTEVHDRVDVSLLGSPTR